MVIDIDDFISAEAFPSDMTSENREKRQVFIWVKWTHPFDVLHSSMQPTLGSVEQLIRIQPEFHARWDCLFSTDQSVVSTELCHISNWWVHI